MSKRKNQKRNNKIYALGFDKPINIEKGLESIKLPDGLYATNVKDKLKYFNNFAKLIKDQFVYGGKKYELLPGIESTDILTLSWGVEGLLWTINKYLFRFKNFHREKDLLKVATYMYILWLKYGFHLEEKHDTDTGKKK